LHTLRKTTEVRQGKEAVVEKNASRKTPRRTSKPRSIKTNSDQQLGFNF
jgi:hypothetical protein